MCRTRRTEFTEEGKKFLDSARTERKIHIDGYEGTEYTWGYGPKKLLMLHGWAGNSQRWQMFVERLDPTKFTCVALDAPGHGKSAGRELHLEIYRKMLDKIVYDHDGMDCIITHSLGGLVTALAYLDNPNYPVKSYIINASPRGVQTIFDYFQNMLKLSDKVMENLERYTDHVLSLPAHDVQMEYFFNHVDVPTLIVHDQDDKVCPAADIMDHLKENPCVKVHQTAGMGHNLEDPHIANVICKYVNLRQPTAEATPRLV